MDLNKLVKEFHEKNGFKVDANLLCENSIEGNVCLQIAASSLASLCDSIKHNAIKTQAAGDERTYRFWLMCEELQEAAQALLVKDEVALADACGDLHYVTSGTMVSYDLPMNETCEEIHRSNMSKQKRTKDNVRMRNKGKDWAPPDLRMVIDKYRKGK